MESLLVGFQDQDNLGLRYLAAAATRAGHSARVVTWSSDPAPLIDIVHRTRPRVIGLSLIFQYMTPDFARVIEALRAVGIDAHITLGGHYPSFDPAEVLRGIPGLDSIARYEGEATFVELLDALQAGHEWRGIAGLAFRCDVQIVSNPIRAAIEDLDELPWPERSDIDYEQQELPTASMLGSRGCPWNCSFCSIRPFYEAQEGKLRRLRRPAAIVAELAALHEQRGVPVFLFQDDDFLAGAQQARDWATAIADELIRTGLSQRIAFKISCRSDEVHEGTLARLQQAGLTHVYMGVESGDEEGLKHMNKHLRPEAHLRAARILKSLGLSFDFGFMLLEPDSEIVHLRHSLDFLEEFVGDGWSVASFCRMLPYAGTPVKQKLLAEGRLLGTPFQPDYRFLDPKLDLFYEWMLATFHERNFSNRGLCNLLKGLVFESHLNLAGRPGLGEAGRRTAHHLTAVCNGLALYTLRSALDHIERTPLEELRRDPSFLLSLTRHEQREEQRLTREVIDAFFALRKGPRRIQPASQRPVTLGSFENSWTLSAT